MKKSNNLPAYIENDDVFCCIVHLNDPCYWINIIKSKMISPGNITFQVFRLSLSLPNSNRDRILQ